MPYRYGYVCSTAAFADFAGQRDNRNEYSEKPGEGEKEMNESESVTRPQPIPRCAVRVEKRKGEMTMT